LEAIWALGKIGGEGVSEFLYDLADDEDEEVREMAEAALEELSLWSEDLEWDEFDQLGEDDEIW